MAVVPILVECFLCIVAASYSTFEAYRGVLAPYTPLSQMRKNHLFSIKHDETKLNVDTGGRDPMDRPIAHSAFN